MTKKELVNKIAAYRVETTPHKDLARHIRNLNKLSKKELEFIIKGVK